MPKLYNKATGREIEVTANQVKTMLDSKAYSSTKQTAAKKEPEVKSSFSKKSTKRNK
tara:strand:+ start:1125 stop:1295 length:171 start_codon:yes stop_codon:yes gene_type:complete